MIVPLIKIGNSKGIRIPRHLIEKCGLSDTVELRVEEGKLVISPSALSPLWEAIGTSFDGQERKW